jgi:hypothetical protein
MTPSPSYLSPLLAADVAPGEALVAVALYALVGVIFSVGLGAAVATLRVILPGLGGLADRSLSTIGGRRLFLAGVLPLLGAALLGQFVAQAGQQGLSGAYALLVLVPLGLLMLLGLLAALPHLGARLSGERGPSSPLGRAALGGLALGLAATTVWLPPLFGVVALLLGGWLLGIGLTALFGRRRVAA